MLSPRYAEAVAYATDAHAGQVRKGTDIPYITHPIAVSSLVIEHGGDEDQAIAGLLHDVIEDCGKTVDEIVGLFGSRVAGIVEHCTDGVSDETGRKRPWQERKEAYLRRLGAADYDTLLVSACDKLHNARAIEEDMASIGPAVFDRFTAGYAGTKWYYRALKDVFAARLGESSPVVGALRASLERTYV
jgi:(p)ppGpp synthase/HD superfamily hydrolase